MPRDLTPGEKARLDQIWPNKEARARGIVGMILHDATKLWVEHEMDLTAQGERIEAFLAALEVLGVDSNAVMETVNAQYAVARDVVEGEE